MVAGIVKTVHVHCSMFRENENIEKLNVFERVEPQLRHLEPVGAKSTVAHLSVHFHMSMHILKIPSTWIISNASEPCGTLRNPKEHFFLTKVGPRGP